MSKKNKHLTIYFDGACPLCSREIEHYRKKDQAQRLRLIDIADPHFDAVQEGVDSIEVQRNLHVRLASGELKTGVDAFIAIWEILPPYRVLAHLAELRLIKPALKIMYFGFAIIRPYLPKRNRTDCKEGACQLRG